MTALIGRREFITLLGGAAGAWPVAALAQQGERVRRIGVFMPGVADDPDYQTRNAAFLQRLAELNWVVGRNIRIEYRWGAGHTDRYGTYADELVAGAGCHLGHWHYNRFCVAQGEPHRSDRIRERY